MIKKILILSLLFSPLVSQADYLEDTFKRIEADDATVLQGLRDDRTGVLKERYDTNNDVGKYSFLYHFNSDLLDFATVSSFEFIFGIKKDFGWIDFSVTKSSARFEEVTENNPAVGAATQELLEDSLGLLTVGVGLSHRTHYIRHLFHNDTLYETVGAFLTYNQVDDSLRSLTFKGGGFKADFGVHKRTSESFHIGGKMSYNLMHVKKAQEFEGESSSSRSLLLSWVTFGLDFTFYY